MRPSMGGLDTNGIDFATAGRGGFPQKQDQNQRAVNRSFPVILAAANTPQAAPGFIPPPGALVRVRANNGTSLGNSGIVFVGTYREEFKGGGGIPLSNGDIIPFPVENLAHAYVYGAAGDGVIFTVTNTE